MEESRATDGLICAYAAGTRGRLEPADAAAVAGWQAGDGTLWTHLDRTAPDMHRWLGQTAGLPPLLVEALLAEETRPRLAPMHDGLLVILRGVNLNPGADPEDMVSIRMWLDHERLISLRGPRLQAVEDVRTALDAPGAPRTPGGLLTALAAGLVARMGPIIAGLEEDLDALEEQLVDRQGREMRQQLVAIRRQGIILRRFIAPQRDVMQRLATEALPWLDETDRGRLRETADRITRYVEDLEALRDRAAVAQEELATRLSDQMNRTIYVLSLVATLFLPLGFITGLLGVNVGGLPGTEDPGAFILLCVVLGVLAVAELVLFRLRRWL
ncbi:Zinc transport protein ZntB [wastewater metagenome]|uniref:Zinc transport protein ZntB n=2 Tax=unclassified sequences TaxID=12908 RepID=A0A5B8RIM9_9ZZZZ|nr:zinc transporter ZntB [Arhodomonas aquaeolei]MCS4503074.1 zinc transporter ZntB [Arhodomonas aquaeolei]QEA06895.1 zinc transport protein ZntB [uncultured organism]